MAGFGLTHKEMDAKAVEHYAAKAKEHEGGFSTLTDVAWWDSRAGQVRRWEVLWEVGVQPTDHVLDLGCGPGGMYEWARTTGRLADAASGYIGVDVVPHVVDIARRAHPEARFIERNVATSPLPEKITDWVLASGVFAWHAGQPHLVAETLDAALTLARKGVAFNALSSWGPGGHEAQTLDPIAVLQTVRAHTPWCALRHDYAPHDWTIYAYHERQGWHE